MIFNILDFKASPDILNTEAIQNALDACSAAGGGTVIIPAGKFRTGTLRLRSHVGLHLEQGAILFASADMQDYNKTDEFPGNWDFPEEEWVGAHLLIGYRVEDVSITGPGMIHGNAEAFFDAPVHFHSHCWREGFSHVKNKETLRPGQLIVFCESDNIRITDIRIRHSPCWSIYLHGSSNVQIRGIQIQNRHTDANTDGIDIDSSCNVIVSDCLIDTGDDCITLRGSIKGLSTPRPCENVTVSNCVLNCCCGGFRIGVGTGIIRNAVIGNCVLHNCGNAIAIMSSWNAEDAEGVDISNIQFHHLDARDTANMLTMRPGNEKAAGKIRHITIDSSRFSFFCSNPILGANDLRFRDCDFIVQNRPASWERPENQFVPNVMNIHDGKDIQFRNCRIRWETSENFWRKAIYAESTERLSVTECDFRDFSEYDSNIKK